MSVISHSNSFPETASFPSLSTCTVAVIGLGYVGLPLAVAFAKPGRCLRTGNSLNRRVIGFDINKQRLDDLRSGIDSTNETTPEELQSAESLYFTDDPSELAGADVFIVTVPTPIDASKRPNLNPLKRASDTLGKALKLRMSLIDSNDKASCMPVIVYESTVYPGATEEECIPIVEESSGGRLNKDFVCGYSPERINPGDTEHRLTTITKVTSGSSSDTSVWIDDFYGSIIKAGTFKASSIRVAEAAKVIENTQRDLNIALVNELAIIFRELGIDTLDVLEASGTKWNFLNFRPGLVGGHCIGVDPYYLTHKAEEVGYYPQVVLAGRRINDGMGRWIVEQLVLEMAKSGQVILGAQVLLLGLTFKENCPDMRNTKVLDVVDSLRRFGIEPVLVDPWIDRAHAEREYGLTVLKDIPCDQRWKSVIVAVAHHQFLKHSAEYWTQLLEPNGVLVDLKSILPRELEALRL